MSKAEQSETGYTVGRCVTVVVECVRDLVMLKLTGFITFIGMIAKKDCVNFFKTVFLHAHTGRY